MLHNIPIQGSVLKKRRILRNTLIATGFLFLFVNAIGKNLLCSIEHLNLEKQPGTASHSHNHTQSHSHSHNHHEHDDYQHGHKGNDHHEKNADKPENKKDECCSDLAQTLYSKLFQSGISKIEFSSKASLLIQEYKVKLPEAVSFRQADFFSWKSPPPKIPDVRILIQSLTI